MSFEADRAVVSWTETDRLGNWVVMLRGTGERGIWHKHMGQEDPGGNPCDFIREEKKYFCRTCRAPVPQAAVELCFPKKNRRR